jgi:hypothetical protein
LFHMPGGPRGEGECVERERKEFKTESFVHNLESVIVVLASAVVAAAAGHWKLLDFIRSTLAGK